MTLEEIYLIEHLSIRSFNVCNNNGLTDLSRIVSHYKQYFKFDNLKNCGKKSNEELISISVKHLNNDLNLDSIFNDEVDSLREVTSKLNRSQREVVNIFIENTSKQLSARAYNALSLILNNDFRIKNLCENVFKDRFDLKNIPNIGSKSIAELNKFLSELTDFINDVIRLSGDIDIVPIKNRLIVRKTFALPETIDIDVVSQSIFLLADSLIKEEVIFQGNANSIFQKGLKIFEHYPKLTLEYLSEYLSLTKERVRQIRNKCLQSMFDNLFLLKDIEDNFLSKTDLLSVQNFLFVDDNLSKTINQTNGTNFSREFISCLLYAYWHDSTELVGRFEDVLIPKFSESRGRHNWKNFFLVDKRIASEFDFYALADDLESRINDKIEETYSLNFKSYLSRFLIQENYHSLRDAASVSEKIINEEFDLYIDIDDNLTFHRKRAKQVHEYAMDILEQVGKPMKIQEIYDKLNLEHPDATSGPASLRGSLLRAQEIIHFGRSSTFGLKKWEDEMEGIKGGTIRRLVLSYLRDRVEPIHIYEITEYVLQFRPMTSAKSILMNLKLDPANVFVFFNQSFLGLKGVEYASPLTNLPILLGRYLKRYVREYNGIDREQFIVRFSGEFEISRKNMGYIIDNLIDNKFINIDHTNKLWV